MSSLCLDVTMMIFKKKTKEGQGPLSSSIPLDAILLANYNKYRLEVEYPRWQHLERETWSIQ